MIKKKIVIIGAGPTGLSVGYFLKKSGFKDFIILDRNSYPGGLSASFKDNKGLIWDLGGHVIHNKNKEFVNFCKKILKKKLTKNKRKAFIYFKKKFIPYPFQNNIAFLPKKYKKDCLTDLINNQPSANHQPINNFYSWIISNFGKSIAKYFMIPQNQKSWQFSLNRISTNWLSKRVSFPPIEEIKKECQKIKPKELNWGSHQNFYYPKNGGVGLLWQKTADLLKDKIKYNTKVVKIDLEGKKLYIQQECSFCQPERISLLSSNKEAYFEKLISTVPLNKLINISNAPNKIKIEAKKLKHNSGLIFGLAYNIKPINSDWHWIYFPEKKYPFFRICQISNFGGNSIPKSNYSSFLAEITVPKNNQGQQEVLKKTIINLNYQIKKIFFSDKNIKPISIFHKFITYYYPIPTLNRNAILKNINKLLTNNNIYSLGRFGSWLYEKGNMDDCFEEAKNIISDLF